MAALKIPANQRGFAPSIANAARMAPAVDQAVAASHIRPDPSSPKPDRRLMATKEVETPTMTRRLPR